MYYQQNLNMLPAFYKTCMHIPYIFYQKTFLPAVIFILIMVFLAYIMFKKNANSYITIPRSRSLSLHLKTDIKPVLC